MPLVAFVWLLGAHFGGHYVSKQLKMTEKTIRPKWLKVLTGLFIVWTSLLTALTLFLIIVWIVQVRIFDIEISGSPALIILITELIISIYFSIRLTKWLNRYLDTKTLRFNYILLIVLILIVFSFIILTTPMTYLI